jgi:putative FmdB family regulatory protein
MPTYIYKCKKCDLNYEVIRAMSAPEILVICESCGEQASRIFGVGAVSFNGSGFYTTDKKEK